MKKESEIAKMKSLESQTKEQPMHYLNCYSVSYTERCKADVLLEDGPAVYYLPLSVHTGLLPFDFKCDDHLPDFRTANVAVYKTDTQFNGKAQMLTF